MYSRDWFDQPWLSWSARAVVVLVAFGLIGALVALYSLGSWIWGHLHVR